MLCISRDVIEWEGYNVDDDADAVVDEERWRSLVQEKAQAKVDSEFGEGHVVPWNSSLDPKALLSLVSMSPFRGTYASSL